VIYFTGSGFSSQTYHSIHFNSSSYNLVFFPNGTGSTFTGTVTLNGNTNIETDGNVFNNLTLKPGYTYTFKSGFTQTINGTLNAIGTPGFPVRIQSSVSGTPAIFSKASGQVCLDYARIKDNTATGGASFNGGLSPTRSFDEGGNSGWVFTGSPNTYYQDADEDGYGNAAITAQTCTMPPGYVTNNTDCNDQDTNVNPGATEVCGNGIDDNCNGAIDEGCCNGSVSAGDDATLYYGYPATQCVTRTATVTNGTGPYTYQWTLDRALLSGESISGDNTPTVTVCLRENANLCITVTDNAGCTYSDCATIQAKDIRCSTGNNVKVNICHNGHTLCVSVNAVAAHLAHGDYLGQCEDITSKGSIEPEIIGTDLILYPNPTAGNFTIRLSLPQDELASAYVQISTMSGRVIQQMQVNGQKNLNATVKEAGLYVVRLISKKRVIAQKITVIH
jgi:Putative metal-binding motif/Secretion system C-terminal sorting domain